MGISKKCIYKLVGPILNPIVNCEFINDQIENISDFSIKTNI